MGEVVGPDRRLLGAGVEVDGDVYLARAQVDQRPVRADRAARADHHAVERHVELLGLEGGLRRTDRRDHATPVRVVAGDRALEQVRARDGSGDLERVVLGRSTLYVDGNLVLEVARAV